MTVPLRFVNNKIEDYALQVTFDPVTGEGTVVYNLSLIKNEDLEYAISIMKDAHKTGVTVSGLVKFFLSGEKINGFVVPAGNTAICTICSITFDGLLIRRGIPVNPIGGGVVEIEKRTPIRFTHIILYQHTTIDPLQVPHLPKDDFCDECHENREREYPRKHPGIPYGGRTSCRRSSRRIVEQQTIRGSSKWGCQTCLFSAFP